MYQDAKKEKNHRKITKFFTCNNATQFKLRRGLTTGSWLLSFAVKNNGAEKFPGRGKRKKTRPKNSTNKPPSTLSVSVLCL